MNKAFFIDINSTHKLYVKMAIPEKPLAIIQICHGMAEHIERYERFMLYLKEKNFLVVGYDQRGHGKSVHSKEQCGVVNDFDNFHITVDDNEYIHKYVTNMYPNLPYFMLGHSMGSFLMQRYSQLYGDNIQGLILIGSNFNKSIKLHLGSLAIKSSILFKGDNYKSAFIQRLIFHGYNKKVKNKLTEYDWLSRDNISNNTYNKDDFCGFGYVNSYYRDMINGFKITYKNMGLIPNRLPIYIISGDKDPVGNYGKGVKRLYNILKKSGIQDITLKIYKDARHELLNEINKEEIQEDIKSWVMNRLKKQA